MKRNANDVVGICGLFCETCPKFSDGICKGCLSDLVADTCIVCKHGFRDCAKDHDIVRCSECIDFPCDRLREFKDCHVVDGISHHEHILDYVIRQREIGIENWVKEQEKLNSCPDCGALIIWCERKCRNCNKEIVR